MNSINMMRENTQHCKEKLLLKNDNANLDKILEIDKEVRSLKTVSGEIRAERNSASEMIAETKKVRRRCNQGHNGNKKVRRRSQSN